MSEYQYYEWQTIDRLLSAAEQKAVNSLSSHIDVTARQAVVTYEWGDFKHDPRQVLATYFDAFLYFANWGTRWLMLRFPAGMLDAAALEPYLVADAIELSTEDGSSILDIRLEEVDSDYEWMEQEEAGTLSAVTSLRNAILDGDYRALYLAWLGAVGNTGPEDDSDGIEEPPVPAGLGKLTPALDRLAEFLNVPEHLIDSAAAASPAQGAAISDTALQDALGALSRAECEAFLLRLVQGEPGVALALRQRLKGLAQPARKPAPSRPAGPRRTLADLSASARRLEQAAAKRQAIEAEARRIADLQALAKRQAQVWQEIEKLLEGHSGSAYDRAVAELVALKALADYQKTQTEFQQRVRELSGRYQSRPAFIRRLVAKHLV